MTVEIISLLLINEIERTLSATRFTKTTANPHQQWDLALLELLASKSNPNDDQRRRAMSALQGPGISKRLAHELLAELFRTDAEGLVDLHMVRPITALFYDDPELAWPVVRALEGVTSATHLLNGHLYPMDERWMLHSTVVLWSLAALRGQVINNGPTAPKPLAPELKPLILEAADQFAKYAELQGVVREIQLLIRGKSDLEVVGHWWGAGSA